MSKIKKKNIPFVESDPCVSVTATPEIVAQECLDRILFLSHDGQNKALVMLAKSLIGVRTIRLKDLSDEVDMVNRMNGELVRGLSVIDLS